MRVLATRYFARWAKYDKVSNKKILDAIHELQNGLHDGNLGGDIYKKRISINNRGKRDSGRTIIAFKDGNNVFCLLGYPKSKKETITDEELETLQKIAKEYFLLHEKEVDIFIKNKKFIEVNYEEKTNKKNKEI